MQFKKKVLSKALCEDLIKTANKYKLDMYDEPIDGKPVYQVDIFSDCCVKNKELWDKCKNLIPYTPSFVFLKRYTPHERPSMNAHIDTSQYTVNFLLSDKNDFKGGEFYIFYNDVCFPILCYDQGDMIAYEGTKHLHGVLPVRSGYRYVLTFFMELMA
jgi:hypothetical protein